MTEHNLPLPDDDDPSDDLDSYVTAPRPVDDVQDDDENEPDDVVPAQDTPELPDDA